jgi:hypothetical protein
LNDLHLQLRSTSLSLDGLLDYTTNDIEESVFEVHILICLLLLFATTSVHGFKNQTSEAVGSGFYWSNHWFTSPLSGF